MAVNSKSNTTIGARLAELESMQHGNYLKKTDEYFEFIGECYQAGALAVDQLDAVTESAVKNKVAFLSLATRCLLKSEGAETQILRYESKYGSKFLIALELNLAIFLKGLNSPRGGPALSKVSNIRKHLAENARSTLDRVVEMNRKGALLSRFVDELFIFPKDLSFSRAMTVVIVVDDLSPLKTATLTKMVFDQIAVMLEYTEHDFIIACSRLHAPNNQFWMPGVHQTRLISLEEYALHYDIPLQKYKGRLSMLNLNEVLYAEKEHNKIAVDAFITYPFRHGLLEPILYAKAPVVEIEIMSGISLAKNCDVVIPNGVPSESFLKLNYAKTALVQPPRRKFKGGEGSGFGYLKNVEKFIVSASKDFDKRAELDIGHFVKNVASFLNTHSDFTWVFVGGSIDFENDVMKNYSELMDTGKIILVGYEQDLPGLFGLAYLYVQPPMIGGGRAPAIAIENNCPALSFQFGDCTKYMPYDCQRKDFNTMFESIEIIACDERKRNELLSICATVIAPTINMEAAIIYESALKRARIKNLGKNLLGA